MTDMRDTFNYGLEYEVLVTDRDFNLLHWHDLPYEMLRDVLLSIDVPPLDYLKTKYPGSSRMPYYLEGYDITSSEGAFKTLQVKGIEIATPIYHNIDDLMQGLKHLYGIVQKRLQQFGYNTSCFGTYPVDFDYEGPRGQRSPAKWASAEVAMTTAGIHVNLSMPDKLEEQLDREATLLRFQYAAPVLALLSANTPFRRGKPWDLDGRIGKSDRTWRRSFTRSTLYFRDDQRFRKELTIFDITNNPRLIAGYTAICMGLLLDTTEFPIVTQSISHENVRRVAQFGYSAQLIDRNFYPFDLDHMVDDVLSRALKGLESVGIDTSHLTPLFQLAAARRTPADDSWDAWLIKPEWPAFLERCSLIPSLGSTDRV